MKHHTVENERRAAKIILDWCDVHAAHDGASIVGGDWSRMLSCPQCGADAYLTIEIRNEAHERAMALYKTGSHYSTAAF